MWESVEKASKAKTTQHHSENCRSTDRLDLSYPDISSFRQLSLSQYIELQFSLYNLTPCAFSLLERKVSAASEVHSDGVGGGHVSVVADVGVVSGVNGRVIIIIITQGDYNSGG